MSYVRQAFLRPVEIPTDCSVSIAGAVGPIGITIPNGVWACWASVLTWFQVELAVINARFVVGWLNDGRLAIANQHPLDFTITGTHANGTAFLRRIGYEAGALALGSQHIADYWTDNAWYPWGQHADQDRYALDQSAAFSGSRAKSGTVSGTTTGPDIYERKFTYQHQPSWKSTREGCLNRSHGIEWEPMSCFERLISESRRVLSSGAGLPSPKGFYYFPRFVELCFATNTPLVDPQPTLPGEMGSGGILFDLLTTPDSYVFGHCNPDGAAVPDASVPRARAWYNCVFEHATAPAPTWFYPALIGGPV